MAGSSSLDAVVRLVVVLAPLAAAVGVGTSRRPGLRRRMAAVLASVAALAGILLLNLAADVFGWWVLADGALLGQPLDLVVAWAVLWGAVPTLLDRWPVAHTLAALAAVDLVAMPFVPGVALGRWWLLGEIVGLLAVALPAVLLGRWTAERRHLDARTALQVGVAAVLLVGVVPVMTLTAGGGAWRGDLVGWVAMQVGGAGALLAAAAVVELHARGQGTPWPWDPPRRVVVSGPYRYLRNPMQAGTVLLLCAEAVALTSVWPLAIAVVGTAFSVTAAGLHEHQATGRRLGQSWSAYRRRTRDWWPTWRPAQVDRAVLWVAEDCGPCVDLGRWIAARAPIGLTLADAGRHPGGPPRRLTYETDSGYRATGVAAFAYALEHADLAWAAVGWSLRLPGVRKAAAVIGDLVGFGAREVPPATEQPGGGEATCHVTPTHRAG